MLLYHVIQKVRPRREFQRAFFAAHFFQGFSKLSMKFSLLMVLKRPSRRKNSLAILTGSMIMTGLMNLQEMLVEQGFALDFCLAVVAAKRFYIEMILQAALSGKS